MIERFILGLVQRFGLLTIVVAGVIFFYEGVFGLRKVPFIDRIPVAGYLIEGRVERYHRLAMEKERLRKQRAVDGVKDEFATLELEKQRAEQEGTTALARAIDAERKAIDLQEQLEAAKVPTEVQAPFCAPRNPNLIEIPVRAQNKPVERRKPRAACICPKIPKRRSCPNYLRIMPSPDILQGIRGR